MNRSPARMRLPEGFSHLRPDLGKILKDHRTGVSGTVGPVSQEALAASVGMTRAALSRIENGAAIMPGVMSANSCSCDVLANHGVIVVA